VLENVIELDSDGERLGRCRSRSVAVDVVETEYPKELLGSRNLKLRHF
jgi:hypothetical protein